MEPVITLGYVANMEIYDYYTLKSITYTNRRKCLSNPVFSNSVSILIENNDGGRNEYIRKSRIVDFFNTLRFRRKYGTKNSIRGKTINKRKNSFKQLRLRNKYPNTLRNNQEDNSDI